MAVHDLSQNIVSIDGQTADPSNDGDFLNIASKPVVTTASAFGGKSSVDVSQVTDREATITCGPYSAWHKLLGSLLRAQRQRQAAGPFEGFAFSFLDPQSGDSVTGQVLIGEEPEIARSATQAAYVWPMIIRAAFTDYGAAL